MTKALVEEALAEAIPIVERMIESGTTEGRTGLQVFVADRTNGRILTARFIGESDREKFFASVAASKLDISLRTGRNTYDVRLCERDEGETRYYGSVVLGNIVVAASGFQAYYDEMVCGILAHTIQAKMKAAAHVLEQNTERHWLENEDLGIRLQRQH